MINALKYTENLEEVGFSSDQAKEVVKSWIELMDSKFATKSDLKDLEYSLRELILINQAEIRTLDTNFRSLLDSKESSILAKINRGDHSLHTSMKEIENSLRSEMKEMENSLRSEMKAMENSLRSEMKEMENSLRSEMKEMENSLRSEMKAMEYRLTIKLGSLMAMGLGLIAILIKF